MTQRRCDLDWLRILAFGWLILYHVGMFYVTWNWHVKSSRASDAIEPLMRLSSPWRLSLLFFIAGAATRFLADKSGSTTALLKSRVLRLVPPLLVAIFVIVPPQSYYEIVEAARALPPGTEQAFTDHFYLKYVTGTGRWCDADGCLHTPTYNHMWFVAYLMVYTLVLAMVLPWWRRDRTSSPAMDAFARSPALWLVPWLAMSVLRATLEVRFGQTHWLLDDWYLHPLYFGLFLFGFLVARSDVFFGRCAELRWWAFGAAALAWGTLEINRVSGWPGSVLPAASLRWTGILLREGQAWGAILAAVGFAHRHLRHTDNRARRVLTEAVFPFYLLHQTIIVVVGHHLDALRWPVALEAIALIGATVLGCTLFYAVGRRVRWLRPWIGLT